MPRTCSPDPADALARWLSMGLSFARLLGGSIMAISVGTAVGAGFGLIGRRPLSVIAWGFFSYLATMVLVIVAFAIVGLPLLMQIVTLRGELQTDPAAAGQLGLQIFGAMIPALIVIIVGGLFINAVSMGAIFRSVLMPEDKGFASLRLSGREGALVLLQLLYIPIFIALYIASIVIIGALAFAGHQIGGAIGGLLIFIGCLAYLGGLIWLAVRFSMAAPMTFASSSVRFFSSWTVTRGESGRLVGMALLLVLIVIGVAIAYAIISSIIGGVFMAGAMSSIMHDAGQGGGVPDPSAFIARLPVLFLSFIPTLIMGAAFQGVMLAIVQGPWAEAYRELAGGPEVAATFS
jgi:hypothetical protein